VVLQIMFVELSDMAGNRKHRTFEENIIER
jgi:hypothetical protein